MQLLLLLFMIFIHIHTISTSCLSSKNKKDPNFQRPNKFCSKLNISFDDGWFLSEPKKKINEMCEQCLSNMVEYYALKSERTDEDEDMDKFTSFCLSNEKISADICSGIILHLRKYQYDMVDASELLKSIDLRKFNYLYNQGYKNIRLDHSLWSESHNIPNLNIANCVLKFGETVKHLPIMEHFIDWFKNKQEKINFCKCDEIFGLYAIYKARKEPEDNNILHKYFDTICTTELEKRNFITENILKCISESSAPIDENVLRQFLSAGIPIFQSGWCTGAQLWTFDDVSKVIRLKPESVSSDAVRTVSYAIEHHFSAEDYRVFIKTVRKYGEDLYTEKCIGDMFKVAFAVKKDYSDKSFKSGWKNIWDSNPTIHSSASSFRSKTPENHIFNIHAELLLDIYTKNNKVPVSCKQFVDFLSKFKLILKQKNWWYDLVTEELTVVKENGITVNNMLQCLQFSLDIEYAIFNKFSMLMSSSSGWSQTGELYSNGYLKRFSEFRKELFRIPDRELVGICSGTNPKFSKNSENGIMSLMNYVFSNKKETFTSIEKLFKKLHDEEDSKRFK